MVVMIPSEQPGALIEVGSVTRGRDLVILIMRGGKGVGKKERKIATALMRRIIHHGTY